MKSISGNIVDIYNKRIYKGTVYYTEKIEKIEEYTISNGDSGFDNRYIMPGFVDSHVHIESSMLVPSEFARAASIFGTVATVSDPHEIANVLGIEGVKYMIENAKKVNFGFYFGAPSCVPATIFETAGAELVAKDIEYLFDEFGLKYLSEMMNYPGVIFEDNEVLTKIEVAKSRGLPIDGHAPGVRGDKIKKYASAGITTDHESYTYEEASEKINLGMKVLIREGSAAKNFEALHNLISEYPEMCMFCSDDKHPDELIKGHINKLVAKAVDKGQNLYNVLLAACINPVKHYKLDTGTLQIGEKADFIVVNNLIDFDVSETYVGGNLIAKDGESQIESVEISIVNNFSTKEKLTSEFVVKCESDRIRVIEAYDGQLISGEIESKAICFEDELQSDIEKDILKIAVVNRYKDEKPALAMIKGFGLKRGAIASSVAHDSHNIIAVGTNDRDIAKAVNEVIRHKGGVVAVDADNVKSLPLPIAGLMSDEDANTVAKKYTEIDLFAKELGSKLSAPFMTLSFMALLVIPDLKLSDKGLFSGANFEFIDLFKK